MRTMRFFALFVLALAILALPSASNAQIAVGISVRVGPPILPVYAQPVCPGPGYIWTPGYWAYGDDGYYWVPGTWVMAPEPGLLWTPGYWGFGEGVYVWHAGYWGPHVGFYGGINYGYGYTGVGFWGGEWRGREFVYNRSVTNVNVTVIHNYYNKTVVVNNVTNVSYNGGPHGIQARASERERIAEREHHFEPRREQIEHEHLARTDRRQWASENHGRPAVAASGRPGEFHRDVVAARESRDNRQDRAGRDRGEQTRGNEGRGRDMGRNDRPNDVKGRDRDTARPRDARDSRPEPSHGRESRAPESHGNPHADRGPAQHGGGHEGNNKPEHGKDRGKEKP
jgi:YXWGXW repeat-containing protein